MTLSISLRPGLKTLFRKPSSKDAESSSGISTPANISRNSSVSSFRHFLESSGNYGNKVDTLGSGISGKVDLYFKKQTKELFAVKTFSARESYESKEEYKSRCHKEFEIIYSLPSSHINIANPISFLPGSSTNQIVFEFVPYSLSKIIHHVKPEEDEALCYFRQVSKGIQFLHRNHISHRDLKLENLMVDDTGTIKIIDFGAAFYFGKEKKQASGIVGTEPFISPEALRQLAYDSEANDVWSLGILLYSILNIDTPWSIANKSDPLYTAFIESRNVIEEKIPASYWDIAMQVLEPDVQKRITVCELVVKLSELSSPHSECSKLHKSTLRTCTRRFKRNVDSFS